MEPTVSNGIVQTLGPETHRPPILKAVLANGEYLHCAHTPFLTTLPGNSPMSPCTKIAPERKPFHRNIVAL